MTRVVNTGDLHINMDNLLDGIDSIYTSVIFAWNVCFLNAHRPAPHIYDGPIECRMFCNH